MKLRQAHQTKHAALSVRARTTTASPETLLQGGKQDEIQALRGEIRRKYFDAVRLLQDQGVTTGQGRATRWTGSGGNTDRSAPGGREPESQSMSGNVGNASAVATADARKVSGILT